MKKIVEQCSKNSDNTITQDAVKLRLRGRGSGYKEGPYNKGKNNLIILESDEPLHLCISSKFLDKYKQSCSLVQELINNVYEEYKRFCSKNCKLGVSKLKIKKEEGISSRKNTINKNDFQD